MRPFLYWHIDLVPSVSDLEEPIIKTAMALLLPYELIEKIFSQ